MASTLAECALACMPRWRDLADTPSLVSQVSPTADARTASSLDPITQGSSCLARGEAYHQGAAVGLGVKHHAHKVAIVLHGVSIGARYKLELLAERSGPRKPFLALPCPRVQAAEGLRSGPSAQLLLFTTVPHMTGPGTGGGGVVGSCRVCGSRDSLGAACTRHAHAPACSLQQMTSQLTSVTWGGMDLRPPSGWWLMLQYMYLVGREYHRGLTWGCSAFWSSNRTSLTTS